MGLYPPEMSAAADGAGTDVADDGGAPPAERRTVLPWTYCPAHDAATCLTLVEELLHLIIILITVRMVPAPISRIAHGSLASLLTREAGGRLAPRSCHRTVPFFQDLRSVALQP